MDYSYRISTFNNRTIAGIVALVLSLGQSAVLRAQARTEFSRAAIQPQSWSESTEASDTRSLLPVLGMSVMVGAAFGAGANLAGLNDRHVEVGPLFYGLGAGLGASIGAKASGLKPTWAATIGAATAAAVPLALIAAGRDGDETNVGSGLVLVVPIILPPVVAWFVNKVAQ